MREINIRQLIAMCVRYKRRWNGDIVWDWAKKNEKKWNRKCHWTNGIHNIHFVCVPVLYIHTKIRFFLFSSKQLLCLFIGVFITFYNVFPSSSFWNAPVCASCFENCRVNKSKSHRLKFSADEHTMWLLYINPKFNVVYKTTAKLIRNPIWFS